MVDEQVLGSGALSAGAPQRAVLKVLRCVPQFGPFLVPVLGESSVPDSSDREAGRLRWEVGSGPPQLQGKVEGAQGTWAGAVMLPTTF